MNNHMIKFKGELYLNEVMAKYTSWRVGGCAHRLYKPYDRNDLINFIKSLSTYEDVVFIGLGSNLLIRDGGIKGTVISMQGALDKISLIENENNNQQTIYVESGVACAKLARFTVEQNLAGGEFFAGIPGTVGGALAMNAGAFGSETWSHVSYVETINRAGVVHKRSVADYKYSYRHVETYKDEWFLAACFVFENAVNDAGKQTIKSLLAKRAETQPTGVFSCGSVFKNPENNFAARLIEECNLKGHRIGGAYVSEKHANFIINDKDASAKDLENLIEHIQKIVYEKHHILLQPEVRIIGEAA